ncbi:MAG TPA: PqqD family protein [Pyrinomonadaceae bacterium]|nr:PqqD family protein [Pyrinomonadaceae bacterium]
MKSNTRLPRALTENFVIRELVDETLVYDTGRDKAHCLNRTAALVWKQCDGSTTVREALRSLNSAFSVPVDEDVIWLAVKQLQRFHLVERTAKSPSVSRRALVLKYAPAALALPVIMSISAPTPAGLSSCVLNGNPCQQQVPCCSGFCEPASNICRPGNF